LLQEVRERRLTTVLTQD